MYKENYKSDGLHYYLIERNKEKDQDKIQTKADASLMKKRFDNQKIHDKIDTLKTFIPAGVLGYLNIEKESWCREIRLVTAMFLKSDIDLCDLKDENSFNRIQIIANRVQRCAYRTRGGLNKFLMDDKGSVMLIAWGLPPLSSRNDAIDAICS